MSKKITIYTRTQCAYCANVKRYLDIKQKQYDVVNLDDNPEIEAEVVAKSGARTVPVVMVADDNGNETVASVGWNPGALAAAIAS
ncbi:MAG: glutaredoxin family protein [Acidobacteriota bacterium]|jgi:glutaredoxin